MLNAIVMTSVITWNPLAAAQHPKLSWTPALVRPAIVPRMSVLSLSPTVSEVTLRDAAMLSRNGSPQLQHSCETPKKMTEHTKLESALQAHLTASESAQLRHACEMTSKMNDKKRQSQKRSREESSQLMNFYNRMHSAVTEELQHDAGVSAVSTCAFVPGTKATKAAIAEVLVSEGWCTREAVAALATRWAARAFPYKLAVSADHQSTQGRLVVIAACAVSRRAAAFTRMMKAFAWSIHTSASYLATMLSAFRAVGEEPTHAEHIMLRTLQREAMVNPPARPHGVTSAEMEEVLQELSEMTGLAAATAYTAAGRFSDVIRVRAEEIVKAIPGWISVTLLEGKVTKRNGPFTFALSDKSPLGEALWAAAQKQRVGYLFDKEAATAELRSAFRPRGWIQSGMRRGAVQHMCTAGAGFDEVRHLTRHPTEKTFNIYTEYGRFNRKAFETCKPYQPALKIPTWRPK